MKQILLPISLSLVIAVHPAPAAQLRLEFADGSNEVTLGWGETIQIDLIWTMQATDKRRTLLSGVNLRFNVNDKPDPDGTDRDDAFVVESVSTPIPEWSTAAASGVGGFFSEFGLFLAAIHPHAVIGVEGDGTEFSTVIASFVLRQADSFSGETYITIRHHFAGDPLPDATQDILDGDGNLEWIFRWQDDVAGPVEFDLGLGNPGDSGPQWTIHGLEIFDPLIIHSVGSGRQPVDDDTPDDQQPEAEIVAEYEPATIDSQGSTDEAVPSEPAEVYIPVDWDDDGVAKAVDLCPRTPRGKAVDNNGCSIDDPMRPLFDLDRDGIPDKDDDCPRTFLAQSVDSRGCSYAQRDDDGDGVRNGADVCNESAPSGQVNHLGCSAARMDQDADGISDAYDRCPDSPSGRAVDGAGCEAEQAAALLQSSAPPARLDGMGPAACGAIGMISFVCMGLSCLVLHCRA